MALRALHSLAAWVSSPSPGKVQNIIHRVKCGAVCLAAQDFSRSMFYVFFTQTYHIFLRIVNYFVQEVQPCYAAAINFLSYHLAFQLSLGTEGSNEIPVVTESGANHSSFRKWDRSLPGDHTTLSIGKIWQF